MQAEIWKNYIFFVVLIRITQRKAKKEETAKSLHSGHVYIFDIHYRFWLVLVMKNGYESIKKYAFADTKMHKISFTQKCSAKLSFFFRNFCHLENDCFLFKILLLRKFNESIVCEQKNKMSMESTYIARLFALEV